MSTIACRVISLPVFVKFGAETYPKIFHVFASACELVVAYLKNLTISKSSISAQNVFTPLINLISGVQKFS